MGGSRGSVPVRVGFLVPLSGPTGIYGPSCLACGELAAEQLNASNGILGRHVELVRVDAGRSPRLVAADVERLVDSGRVDALAGWHISAVRNAVTDRVGGRVLYAYSAMHEGRDDTAGVVMLGERPSNQVLPAMRRLAESEGVRRWAIIGNNYVFPRVSAAAARAGVEEFGAEVVFERYVPLGTSQFSDVLADFASAEVDGVLMLLMGQDAVHFNRQFARRGLAERIVRFSPAVEENTLLGGGGGSNDRLFSAAAYFDSLSTQAASTWSQSYYSRFGEWAPMLNAVGESCYEAVIVLALLAERAGSLEVSAASKVLDGLEYASPRGHVRIDGNRAHQDVYFAQADGLGFTITDRLAP